MTRIGSKTVLLIEDNPGDSRLLREMLSERATDRMEITYSTSMLQAEHQLTKEVFDIILLDLGLPDAQGLEAVQRTHTAAPHTPLVVLTGLDDEALASQVVQAGAQDHLIKGQVDARGLLRAMGYAIERKTMAETLFAEKERAQVTLNSIGDAVISCDISGNVTFLNLVAEKMTGWSWQEGTGHPMAEVFRVVDATTRKIIADPVKRAVVKNRPIHLPLNSVLIRRDGREIPIEDSVAPIHDHEGETTGAVIVFRDISSSRAMALQMAYSAQHDFLTDLPNRLLLNDRINQAITLAQRNNNKVAVLFLDLDRFKHINDSLGHPIGDRLLQSIAKRLTGCVRASDTVSRQGGDEFIILLSEVVHAGDAAIAARMMLEAIATAHPIEQRDLHITGSIGVSVYPDDGLDAETLIMNADVAMYQAKENGRQSYQFFTSEMNLRAVERQFIVDGIRRALAENEFALHYQPKIDLKTGEITGVEALIRWAHPTRGLVSPAQFIPVAEDCGLILAIDDWVLREACRQARAWLDAGLPSIVMAVNVSAMEFRSDKFVESVFGILKETGLAPSSLELELTEGLLMKHAETTENILKALEAGGVRVAIDDFGTGYSSLSYLQRFQLNTLKIDQSFVRQISAAGEKSSIVSAVINMARSLKLCVVAEGVETLEELTFLRNHDCDQAQGYYFSRPVPPSRLANLLANGIAEADCGAPPSAIYEDVLDARTSGGTIPQPQ